MKGIQTTRVGLAVGTLMLGYGIGLVSVQAGNAETTATGAREQDARFTERDGVRDDRRGKGREDDGRPPLREPRGDGHPDDVRRDNGRMGGPRLQDMLDELDLNVSQLTKIQTAQANERIQMEALHAQMEKVRANTRAAIEAALTAEQRQKLAQAEKEMASHRGRRGSRDFDGRGPRHDRDGKFGGRPDGPSRGDNQRPRDRW
jgi:Spy/CpxP family protein refolding chaperone